MADKEKFAAPGLDQPNQPVLSDNELSTDEADKALAAMGYAPVSPTLPVNYNHI